MLDHVSVKPFDQRHPKQSVPLASVGLRTLLNDLQTYERRRQMESKVFFSHWPASVRMNASRSLCWWGAMPTTVTWLEQEQGLCFACGLFCRQVKKLLTTLSKCSRRVRPFWSRCIQSSNLWSSCRGKAGKYWNMAARTLFLPSRTTHALSPAGTVCLLAEQHLGCLLHRKEDPVEGYPRKVLIR